MTLWECVLVCFCTHLVNSLLSSLLLCKQHPLKLAQNREDSQERQVVRQVHWYSFSLSIFPCVAPLCPLGTCSLGNSCAVCKSKNFQQQRVFFPRLEECSSWKRFLYGQLVSCLLNGKTLASLSENISVPFLLLLQCKVTTLLTELGGWQDCHNGISYTWLCGRMRCSA